ncbi:MAG: FAD binding domain-containing protein [Nocardioides sp.]
MTVREPLAEVVAAAAAGAQIRAGGTDLTERRRHRRAVEDVTDLTGVPGLDAISPLPGGGTRIGAMVSISMLGEDPMSRAYPALVAAADGLATPQIRRVGTLGGNLLQHNRCWYYRHPRVDCLKKGGAGCPARDGEHLYGVCFDAGPCVAPHPSTLGMALLAHDATVELTGGRAAEPTTEPVTSMPLAEVYGDGSEVAADTRHHLLPDGAVLTHVVVPAPLAGERGSYARAISRSRAEWPLVEALARIGVEGDRLTTARVTVGGVAPVPLRLPLVEEALTGATLPELTPDRLGAASALAAHGVAPLPMTGYKVDLLRAMVLEVLERVLGRTAQ